MPAPPGGGELAADTNQVWLATAEAGPRLLSLDPESLEIRREERIDAVAETHDPAIQRGADGIRLVLGGVGHEGGGTVAWVDLDTWAYEAVSLPRPVNRIAEIDGGWWVTYALEQEGGPGGVAFLARKQTTNPCACPR